MEADAEFDAADFLEDLEDLDERIRQHWTLPDGFFIRRYCKQFPIGFSAI